MNCSALQRNEIRLGSMPGKAPSRQKGVGLIEVLVAVLILALGLLGMAGLQSKSLRANQSSYSRSQAVMLSYYMMDVMRADRASALLGNYDQVNVCSTAAITGTALSDNNLRDWVGSLRAALGDEATTCGGITCDGTTEVCTVRVIWNDERAGGLGNQTFETRSRL
jgi:type IV pilus assembly protein PilV